MCEFALLHPAAAAAPPLGRRQIPLFGGSQRPAQQIIIVAWFCGSKSIQKITSAEYAGADNKTRGALGRVKPVHDPGGGLGIGILHKECRPANERETKRVQSIFSSPARLRSPSLPAYTCCRRAAKLKMLCTSPSLRNIARNVRESRIRTCFVRRGLV